MTKRYHMMKLNSYSKTIKVMVLVLLVLSLLPVV
nr:MAG TPA: protein of unknown function (DUF5113) [Caudoviricetes sp.]